MPSFVIPFKNSTDNFVVGKLLPNSHETIALTEDSPHNETAIKTANLTKGSDKAEEADVTFEECLEASEPTESASQFEEHVVLENLRTPNTTDEPLKKHKISKARAKPNVLKSDAKDKMPARESLLKKDKSNKKLLDIPKKVLNSKITKSKSITKMKPKETKSQQSQEKKKEMIRYPTQMVSSIENDTVQEITSSRKMTYSRSFMTLLLSQPSSGLSQKERLVWLQQRRKVGIWVECCQANCKKWRYLSNIFDPLEVPEKWYCSMNSDITANNCDVKEWVLTVAEEEDLIHSVYSAGSLVWAHMHGYPPWPGIVDDCPDSEQFYWLNRFSDIPTFYNITFFDEKVSRAWIPVKKLFPYARAGRKIPPIKTTVSKELTRRLALAIEQADHAMTLEVATRLEKYSFVARYKGPINSPISAPKRKRQRGCHVATTAFDTDTNDSDNSSVENSSDRILGKLVRESNADMQNDASVSPQGGMCNKEVF